MPRFKDDALVLRQRPWSESSQLVTLLTREHGLIRGLAKGSQRESPSSRQRFSGGFALLTAGQVIATTRRSTGLAALTEWDLQHHFPRLRRSLAAQHAAMVAAELAEHTLAEEDPHPGAYHAVWTLLQSIGESRPTPATDDPEASAIEPALLHTLWNLLLEAGYRPELQIDVRTGEAMPTDRDPQEPFGFDARQGGLTNEPTDSVWRVRPETVRVLRQLDRDPNGPASPTLEPTTARRCIRLLLSYTRELLGKEPGSFATYLAQR